MISAEGVKAGGRTRYLYRQAYWLVFLSGVTVASLLAVIRASTGASGPVITAACKAGSDAFECTWNVTSSSPGSLVVRAEVWKKDDVEGKRSIGVMEGAQGRYRITRYSKGVFTMEVKAEQGSSVGSKVVEVTTEGNGPKVCPSRYVWTARSADPPGGVLDPWSFKDLLRDSTLAVEATVKDIEFCPPVVGGSTPFTFVTLGVHQVLFGQFDKPEITIPMAGGFMDGSLVAVSIAPFFLRGEKVVLFLGPWLSIPINAGTGGMFLVSSEGSMRTYTGLPLTEIQTTSGLYQVDTAVVAQPKRIDDLYGGYELKEVSEGEQPALLKAGPAPVMPSNTSLAVQTVGVSQFAQAIRTIQEVHSIAPRGEWKLVPPGTPFHFGPFEEAPPPSSIPQEVEASTETEKEGEQ